MAEVVKVAIGIGCQSGVALATLEAAIESLLAELSQVEVVCLATHERKSDEPALRALCRARGWPLRFYPAARLAEVRVPNPSSAVARRVGSPSVAEAAALCAAGGALLLPKRVQRGSDGRSVTLAVACCQAAPSDPAQHQGTR